MLWTKDGDRVADSPPTIKCAWRRVVPFGSITTGPRPDPPFRSVKVSFNGFYASSFWTNVMWLHLDGSGEITHSVLTDLAESMHNIFAGNFLPLLSSFAGLTETQVVLYADGGPFEATHVLPIPGEDDGTETLPSSVAACISWKIAAHYRGGHPRTYLGGLTRTWTNGVTTWTVTFIDLLTAGAQNFLVTVNELGAVGSGITDVVLGTMSFQHAGDWRDPPVFRPYVDAVVDSRIDTQRRRLGRDRT